MLYIWIALNPLGLKFKSSDIFREPFGFPIPVPQPRKETFLWRSSVEKKRPYDKLWRKQNWGDNGCRQGKCSVKVWHMNDEGECPCENSEKCSGQRDDKRKGPAVGINDGNKSNLRMAGKPHFSLRWTPGHPKGPGTQCDEPIPTAYPGSSVWYECVRLNCPYKMGF